eukprot:CAMPEP_0194154458 /NCGR_PEP_ID=MMETSP0152-20130528/60721_1 /TAXON_ID=1049557 /ORGANISM="Thalassiothrix antarctica, Strain L6-D1" /LENGTH=130 /DNA_ID=CAMNT_0038860577 /DNA_START=20 /DNA_END=409 /DNA_ORIENTATION=+
MEHATARQVSYSEENVGKKVKRSKIRVTWSFVSDRKHEIILAWSKTTGKQEITMDGEVIWFARHKGRSVLDHHWTTRDDESLKLRVLATCAPKIHDNFRNYDLLIDGKLFASLPQYEGLDSSQPTGQTTD